MRKLIAVFAAAGLTAVSAAAFAQTAVKPAPVTPVETITVIAPLLVYRNEIKTQRTPVLDISVQKEVSYADLDMSTPEGGAKLKTRIKDAAGALCKQLEAQYPVAVYVPVTNQDCVKSATSEANETADIIISAWHRS